MTSSSHAATYEAKSGISFWKIPDGNYGKIQKMQNKTIKTTNLNESMAKIAIPIQPKSKEELLSLLKKAEKVGDLVEIWGDKLGKSEIEDFSWTSEVKSPLIFCLKDKREKGSFVGTEKERISILRKACQAFDFVDVGVCTEKEVIKELINSKDKKAQIILSYHDFEKTPSDLDSTFQDMLRLKPNLIKIAVKANNLSDSLKILDLATKNKEKAKCIFLSMGKWGKMSRVSSPMITRTWGYAALDEESINADGQLTVAEMKKYQEPLLDLF